MYVLNYAYDYAILSAQIFVNSICYKLVFMVSRCAFQAMVLHYYKEELARSLKFSGSFWRD